MYFSDPLTELHNFLTCLPMRVNREIEWGGCVCLGKIVSRRLLMDGGRVLSRACPVDVGGMLGCLKGVHPAGVHSC